MQTTACKHSACSINYENRIVGVIINVLAQSVVDRGFEFWSGRTKIYEIDICCFSTKRTTLRRKNNHWLSRNQDKGVERHDLHAICCSGELAL